MPSNWTEANFTKWVGAKTFHEAVEVTFRSSEQNGKEHEECFNKLKTASRENASLQQRLAAAEKERDGHKAVIDAVIEASGWDGVDCGIADCVRNIRIERDEAQQWIDSEPDWKAKYNANYLALQSKLAAVEAERSKLMFDFATFGNAIIEVLRAGGQSAITGAVSSVELVVKDLLASQSREAALRTALEAALDIAEGLAGQQAMEDNWYVEPLKQAREALASPEPKS